MKRDGHKDVTFFVGPEVEHTPAYSKRTLFVVGFQDTAEIEKQARANKTPHIFLGANHSFDASHYTDHFGKTWDDQITHLLDKGFWVTLDYQAHQHETVLKMLNPGVWQSRLFVPLLGVRIPCIETSNPNLTVKIDDVDFKATNRGVWCMHFHEVTDSNRFTDWQDYESDSVVNVKVERTGASIMSNLETLVEPKTKVEEVVKEELNDTSLGLDTVPTTSLKPDTEEVMDKISDIVKTPADAAAAYADGATQDPLSEAAPKKVKATKK